jgi:hypothetical protein
MLSVQRPGPRGPVVAGHRRPWWPPHKRSEEGGRCSGCSRGARGPSLVAGEAASGELAVVSVAVPWSWLGIKREMDGPLVCERRREGGVEGGLAETPTYLQILPPASSRVPKRPPPLLPAPSSLPLDRGQESSPRNFPPSHRTWRAVAVPSAATAHRELCLRFRRQLRLGGSLWRGSSAALRSFSRPEGGASSGGSARR